MYYLRDDYNENSSYIPLDSTRGTDGWQNIVYALAKEIYVEHGLSSVLDIGCGSGYKTIKFFGDKALGLEVPPNISWLKTEYPEYNWEESDFNNPPSGHYDLIICSDVIEHLENPDELLDFINSVDFSHLVISTPDRNLLVSGGICAENGPPKNPLHIREWSFSELGKYIGEKFQIISHINPPAPKEYGQLIHAIKMES
jgi:SAM-dependent methyltransferase